MAFSIILASLWTILGELFYWIYALVVVILILVVVLGNRTPAKTMAWVLVLTFLPVAGVVLYIIFGRDNHKKRLISRHSLSRLSQKSLRNYEQQPHDPWPQEFAPLIAFFKNVNMSLPFAGNEVEIYTQGLSMLHSLLREIYRAKDHIHIQFYIFANDATGRLVRDALFDAAARGVEVRLLYDDVGCWSVPGRFFDEMRAGGVDARGFFRVRFPLFTSKVNYRNHRKLVVIDGVTGFVGGMNIADRYMKGVPWGVWRDTHLLIKGCAVYGLQTSFLADWYFTDGSMITARKYYPPCNHTRGALVQIVTSQPIGQWRDIMRGLVMVFNRARRYIYVETPYFMPGDSVMQALQNSALAGVDVRVMIPEKSDSIFTQLASFSYLGDLLRAGVKVYLYKKGFLHSKMIVSDDSVATVGSTNVDFRSFDYNFEVNAFVYDEPLAMRMKGIFMEDQRDSYMLTLKMYQERGRWRKVKESFIRLLSPIL